MYQAYLITNDITGQQYVGVSRVGLKNRFKQHWLDALSEQKERKPTKLHTDMLKYGIDHFHIELIEDNIADEPKELHENAERKYIAAYQTYYLDEKDGYYPDYSCNIECYTNNHILEIETLSPLQTLKPNEQIVHKEHWKLK